MEDGNGRRIDELTEQMDEQLIDWTNSVTDIILKLDYSRYLVC
jgi:hypothetical protein